MCRFIAYTGEGASPARLVFGGTHSLRDQSFRPREMLTGSVNADGYGVAWYAGESPVRVAEPYPVWQAEGLERLLSTVASGMIVAFVRNTTPGIPPDRSGLPPLLLGRWCFGLNGYVEDFRRSSMRRLHALLPDALHAELRGVSDTEALFLLAVREAAEGARPDEALRKVTAIAAGAAREAGVAAQLNMVLGDGREIALTRTGTLERTNSLYLAERGAFAPGGVVAASEPPDEGAWEPVPPHSVVRLRPGADPEIVPLDP